MQFFKNKLVTFVLLSSLSVNTLASVEVLKQLHSSDPLTNKYEILKKAFETTPAEEITFENVENTGDRCVTSTESNNTVLLQSRIYIKTLIKIGQNESFKSTDRPEANLRKYFVNLVLNEEPVVKEEVVKEFNSILYVIGNKVIQHNIRNEFYIINEIKKNGEALFSKITYKDLKDNVEISMYSHCW